MMQIVIVSQKDPLKKDSMQVESGGMEIFLFCDSIWYDTTQCYQLCLFFKDSGNLCVVFFFFKCISCAFEFAVNSNPYSFTSCTVFFDSSSCMKVQKLKTNPYIYAVTAVENWNILNQSHIDIVLRKIPAIHTSNHFDHSA